MTDGNPTFDKNKRSRKLRDIQLICPSLLVLFESLTVSIAHFTVKEYLQKGSKTAELQGCDDTR